MGNKELGDYMRNLREKQRLSLRKAAQAAQVSITYLWQIEKGSRNPSADVLKKLALVYGVTIRELFEEAGYIEKPASNISDIEMLKWAIESIKRDPTYSFGTRVKTEELTPEAMKFIIEMYEKTTGKKLLS